MRAKAIASDTNMSNNYDESHGAFVTRWHHPCGIVPECAVRVTG